MRYGVVSDIHCQADALKLAIESMGPIEALLCLGDSIDQFRFCNETVALLRSSGAHTLVGNHEEAFFAGEGRRASYVDPDLADWLEARPDRLQLQLGGRRLLLVHSTPWRSNHAYVAETHADFSRFEVPGVDILLYGHTHQPVVRRVGNTLVVNPGSVGEGRPTLNGFVRSFAVLDPATLHAEIIELD
jgi:putative phosphoesterase